ncbi:MAG: hypothetical protein AAF743_05535, partial [Planctomycetota bacterium]
TSPATAPATAPADAAVPEVMLGEFVGTVALEGPDGVRQQVPMKLEVVPDGKGVTWIITYGEGEAAQVRPYVLLPTEASGRFIVDERNGLLIDHTLVGNTLHGGFTINDSFITTRYAFNEEGVEVELVTFVGPRRTSQTFDGSFEVTSPTVAGLQHGTLERQ